ncbi:helix-turn-helix domain-containing protein [Clostridium chromiireducens]|uniref:Helix-turn-helix domain-containing protein n=1 Tax=Clostridium chromiireducens TaxID=225345 RepID=A0A964RLQ1_9CLOT|nr:AraC family transcriptional regulator [Clostridium chromiireducens]MVX63972.1 helix-turn-helix domain-containing protein [Clostridium chromiireducens]
MSYKFGSYGFIFFDEIPNPPFELKDMGVEKRNTSDYYFDNNLRDIKGYLFQYTLKGYGVFESGNQKYRIEAGKAFFVEIPDDEKYYCPDDLDEDGWQILYIHFEGTAVKSYYDKIVNKTGKIITLSENSSVIQYLLKFHENLSNGMHIQPFVGSETVFHFLCLLCSKIAYNQDDYSMRTRIAIERMENEFSKLEGINALAEVFGISLSHFTREFTKETGVNPLKYLTNIRMQHAMELLHNTELSVNEIALKCGFSCGNYFSKCFKKNTKLTPYQFRNERN